MLALPFLGVTPRQGKPRATGLTIVRDQIRPLEEQRQFLETYAPFIDYAKLSNISAALYPETFIDAKIALYRTHDVTPLFGGIVFENAYVRDKLDEFVAYIAEREVAVEISDNVARIPALDRLAIIERLQRVRVEIICEVGAKYPTKPFDVEALALEIEQLCAAGIKLVVLERGEIDMVLGPDGQASTAHLLAELIARVGKDRIMPEVETKEHMVHMIKHFGSDINLGPNVDWELVRWLEPARHGIGRDIGHTTIAAAAGDKDVRSNPQ
ncbi:MAG: phosphosulfolactate synthase [Geminicoccaceae bacterium]